MLGLITETVASAVALGGGSRRGVGGRAAGRQAARCSRGLQSEEGGYL